MTFFPFVSTTDDRRTKALAPMVLRNCFLENAPEGSPRANDLCLSFTPGLALKRAATSAEAFRGLFAQPGVVDGALFGVIGGTLYSFGATGVATSIGAVPGGDRVQWGALRSDLLILSAGELYVYDGASLAHVTDGDFPADAFTLAAIDQRAFVTVRGADQFYWSDVLNAAAWASVFATSERRPDEIIAAGVLQGQLWYFGRSATEIYVGGGDDSLPIQVLQGASIEKGCAARDSLVLIDQSFFFLGDDRVVYRTEGYNVVRCPNRDLEARLAPLSDAEVAEVIGFSYFDGSRIFYVLRPPTGAAFVFDVANITNQFELSSWEADAYRIAFTARAYGQQFAAGPITGDLFTYDPDSYTENTDTIERVFTIGVPVATRMTVSSLAFDMSTYDQPLTGQGADPEMMITVFKDGGRQDSLSQGIERRVKLGARGKSKAKPMTWRLGQVDPQFGMVITGRITDPVGSRIFGVRVNEGMP